MSWKCELVIDLAPLYHDGAASEVSKRLVKKHLRECPQCRAYYKKYQPIERIHAEIPHGNPEENYVMLAKRVRKRRMILWCGFLFYLSATLVAPVLHYMEDHKN